MAITKLLRIKESKKGNKSAGLKRCIDYICNPEKTDGGRLVVGNCGGDPDFIYAEMAYNKMSWQKESGSQGYHYVISFPPDEKVSPELALRAAQDFCDELLNGQYIYICAAHTDQEHMHVHVVFDSVSFIDGLMYHSGKDDWQTRIQPITDSVCKKHGLSILEYDPEKERKCMYHNDWERAKRADMLTKDVTWNDIIRDDIDYAIALASDWNDFLRRMGELRYSVRDGKYLSLQPEGRDKAMRSIRLGTGYSKEELQQRIGTKEIPMETEGRDHKTYGDAVKVYRKMARHIMEGRPYSPMQRDWLILFLRVRHYRNPSYAANWKVRQEIAKIGKITDQLIYLFEHDITSISDIQMRLSELNKVQGKEAASERRLLRGIAAVYDDRHVRDIVNSAYSMDYQLPSPKDIFQIHINEVLYAAGDLQEETFTARIPGTDRYVRLYSVDSRSYNDGRTISSYIYSDADYQLEDQYGNTLGWITGESLKDKFKTRKISRQDSKENRKGDTSWIRRN